MTPHERAIQAINARLESLQADLREVRGETAQQFLVQSLIVTLGVAEAFNEYIRQVGEHAKRRHAALKRHHDSLEARHGELLDAGKELLEKFRADPADRAVRKEIEQVQQQMEQLQKTLRRGANELQRELAAGLAIIDPTADSLRRLAEAQEPEALKRLLRTVIERVHDLYGRLPGENIIQAEPWEEFVVGEIDRAADFYDAYARAGYQSALALELMAMTAAEAPPQTTEDATQRANAAVAARLKDIAARLAKGTG